MKKALGILALMAVLGAVFVACSAAPGEREYKAGVRELRRGQYVRAKALLEKSIQQRPASEANAAAYNYLGLASAQLGLTAEAVEAFENSRRLSPAVADPAYNLGLLLMEHGDAARAVRAFSDAATLDPNDTRALECLGEIYTRARQWPEARRALYSALNRAPQSERVLTAIARVEAESGAPDQAVVTLLKALEQNASYAPAFFNLGLAYESLTNVEAAAGNFQRFIDSKQGSDAQREYARAALARLRPQAASGREPPAPVETKVEPAPAATTTPAPPAAPAPTAPSAATAEDMLAQAGKLADRGKNELALDICLQVAGNAERGGNLLLQEKALRTGARICFDEPRAHYELGRFLSARGKPELALKSFKQAIILDGKFTAAQLAMADAAVQSGEVDAALAGLKQAVEADPKSTDALFALAVLYDKQLDLPEKAAATYAEFAQRFAQDSRSANARNRARELSPSVQFPQYNPIPAGAPAGDVTARVVSVSAVTPKPPSRVIAYKRPTSRNTRSAVQAFNRGKYYQEQSRWDDAINYYIRSLENDDQLANTWYNLGAAYTVKRDFDLAKDAYLRTLAIQPDQVNARYNLALLYREQNDPAAAISLLKDVIKSQPGYAAAHYVLGYLYADNASTLPLAKQHYKEFLRLAPQDPAARAVQQWLSSH